MRFGEMIKAVFDDAAKADFGPRLSGAIYAVGVFNGCDFYHGSSSTRIDSSAAASAPTVF